MTASEIRQQFLDFFASKGHTIVPSAPVVIKNDPTLLFTNAGMNQFKDYFLGNKPAPHPRVADTQKCLRVSGKHNDLEEVGVDTYHHTLFEMLGNWSFGDYFKKEAIAWSWELLTEVYKLDKDRLYVTIFEGDEKEGLAKDTEAYDEWKKVIAEDRILLGNKKDNFWEMGDTGPCGPCSEIHFDSRSDTEREVISGASRVNADDPQVIEIWNNVFMQFNRVWSDKAAFDEWSKANPSPDKNERAKKIVEFTKLVELPAKHVDTGMGFERLVRVIQGKTSNYDTDVFTGTIAEIEKITGKKYDYSDSKQAVAFRVISDHIRAICFTIADGQLPSNTGAGYVIRRILRRAVRYAYSYLDYKQPLLNQLVPVLAKQFENVFPELQQQVDFVSKVVLEEENGFLRTLESGLKRMDKIILGLDLGTNSIGWAIRNDSEAMDSGVQVFTEEEKTNNAETRTEKRVVRRADQRKKIAGKAAFELFDTYGFPIDLVKLIASENDIEVDDNGFEIELLEQKSRSRAATAIDAGDWVELEEDARNSFVGYNSLETQTKVLKYRKVNAKGKDTYQIVLEETPFYAESGGQVGDTGVLTTHNSQLTITNTKKEGDLIIHFADTLPEDLTGVVTATVDKERRGLITGQHSATHLLQAALRQVLGSHVAQKGSLNNAEGLRFDFSHFAKVTDAEIAQIEAIVNEKIRENIPVVIKEMSKEEALESGATALFGEKYGDTVRVVTIDPTFSVELCGGTHVGATGELGLFKIKHETAVAAGVRRIEAISGKPAFDYVQAQLEELQQAKLLLKNPKEFAKAIENLQSEKSALEKRIGHLEDRMLVGVRNELLQKDEIINQINFIGDIIEVSSADALRKLCLDLKNHLSDFVVVLCANIGGKPFVAISIADNVVAARGLDASAIIKQQISPLIKGGGGGQKNLATAGGQEVGNLQGVIDAVRGLL